ncbi:hypothetical protein T08_4720 [Trichinella sp. T8]|nr:hypothetical protein T08_4720 [Trichinella sp. T8]
MVELTTRCRDHRLSEFQCMNDGRSGKKPPAGGLSTVKSFY